MFKIVFVLVLLLALKNGSSAWAKTLTTR